jgi:NAD(P)-dependent dehydrogenase (short-subunit alcohol dehydrogenase family)
MSRLAGKAAIITGGEGSIGMATARALAAEGASVFLAGLDSAAAIFDNMIPLGRHAAPEQIARAMVFLASDDSSFVTGTTLAVDGGMSR